MKHAIFVSLLSLLTCTHSARILIFCPVPSQSSTIIAQRLGLGLAENDHQITIVSPFPLRNHPIPPNYRDIVIPVTHKEHTELTQSRVTTKKQKNLILHLNNGVNMMIDAASNTLNHPEFKKLMAYEKFDLVIFGTIYTSFQQGLAAHFNCPFVILSTLPPLQSFNEFIGQTSNPEAVPGFFIDIGTKSSMTLWERVLNMVRTVVEYGVVRFFDYKNAKLYR